MNQRNIVRAVIYRPAIFPSDPREYQLVTSPIDPFYDLEFLLLHKRKHQYWECLQGGVEQGEHPLKALLRETTEEAGILHPRIHPLTQSTLLYQRQDKPITVTVDSFAILKQDRREHITLDYTDHDDWGWVSLFQAYQKLRKYPDQRLLFIETVTKLYAELGILENLTSQSFYSAPTIKNK